MNEATSSGDGTGEAGATTPEVSVVIPAHNEAENLATLVPEIAESLADVPHEIVIVDDASTDATPAVIETLAAKGIAVRRLAHRRSLGQSAAVMSGVVAARGALVVTLDGDGQNDPRFIPAMLAALDDPTVGLVAGQRLGRKATTSKRLGSKLANNLRRALLKDDTRDTGCGLKAFRREPFVRLPYFQGMHRYLPALFLGDGWKIAHVDVVDRERHHGASHYGVFDRLAVGIPDLFGVWWILRRRRRNPFRVENTE
ncbi:MAG: glycosyltransferase family 2 protein [Bauldia sp.]|nr:glycosyltransferase family 2 protein [Bauldia sp.]